MTGAVVLATVPEKSRRILLRGSREPATIEKRAVAQLHS
jgi:hypothetical protein